MLNLAFSKTETLSLADRLAGEREWTGLYLSGHPLDEYSAYCASVGAKTAAELAAESEQSGTNAKTSRRYVGFITDLSTHITKKNEPMAYLRTEDLSGEMNLTVFPQIYSKYAALLTIGSVLDFSVSPPNPSFRDRGSDRGRWIVNDVAVPRKEPPAAHRPAEAVCVYLRVKNLQDPLLEKAEECIRRHPGPAEVLIFLSDDRSLKSANHLSCATDAESVRELKEILGQDSVVLKTKPRKEGTK